MESIQKHELEMRGILMDQKLLFLLSPTLLSMRHVPAGSFCMISVSFSTFIPASIHSYIWVMAIFLVNKEKNSEGSALNQSASIRGREQTSTDSV